MAVSFTNPVWTLVYDDADCSGAICLFISAGDNMECTLPLNTIGYAVMAGDVNLDITVEVENVAVNPTNGLIYILYTVDNVPFLGTIDLGSPKIYQPNPPKKLWEITEIVEITDYDVFGDTNMVFDCEGNLFGIEISQESTSSLVQINIETGVSTTIDPNIPRCNNTACDDMILYNYNTEEYYRISSSRNGNSLFWTRSTITGTDMPVGGTAINYNGFCSGKQEIVAAKYIGNDVSLVKCFQVQELYILDTSNILDPIVREIDSLDTSYTSFTYVGDIVNLIGDESNDVCVPKFCSDETSGSFDSDETSTSSESINVFDAALVQNEKDDVPYSTITIRLSKKIMLNLWVFFIACIIVSAIGYWYFYKSDV